MHTREINEREYKTSQTRGETVKIKLTRERWYILGTFISLSFAQNMLWNTWGPIAQSAKFAFGWNNSTIALMSNWGPISFIFSGFLFSWLLYKNLRWSVVISAFVVFLGAGVKCLITSHSQSEATWIIHTGQFLNGLGGPVLMGGCPVVSALWFPEYQRATATGLGSGLGLLGYAVSFILGPYIVPDVNKATQDLCANHSSPLYDASVCDAAVHEVKANIMLYMYLGFALSGALFLLVLIRFPARPKFPPTLSASIERAPFLPGLTQLVGLRGFWMLCLPYAVSGGVLGVFGTVLDINMAPLGVTQEMAGWLGFMSTMAGLVAIVAVGIFADVFERRMKLFLLTLFSIGTVSFLLFALACSKVVPFNIVFLYVTDIVGSMAIFGATPLFFELSCESAYPVAEGVTNTMMTWLNNLMGLIFLSVLMIPATGTAWTNWCLAASVGFCLPVLVFYKERYTRLDGPLPPTADPSDPDRNRLCSSAWRTIRIASYSWRKSIARLARSVVVSVKACVNWLILKAHVS